MCERAPGREKPPVWRVRPRPRCSLMGRPLRMWGRREARGWSITRCSGRIPCPGPPRPVTAGTPRTAPAESPFFKVISPLTFLWQAEKAGLLPETRLCFGLRNRRCYRRSDPHIFPAIREFPAAIQTYDIGTNFGAPARKCAIPAGGSEGKSGAAVRATKQHIHKRLKHGGPLSED